MVPDSEPVQLAEDVRAMVFVETPGGRVRAGNRITLRAGQWVVTDPGEVDEPAKATSLPARGD